MKQNPPPVIHTSADYIDSVDELVRMGFMRKVAARVAGKGTIETYELTEAGRAYAEKHRAQLEQMFGDGSSDQSH